MKLVSFSVLDPLVAICFTFFLEFLGLLKVSNCKLEVLLELECLTSSHHSFVAEVCLLMIAVVEDLTVFKNSGTIIDDYTCFLKL